MKSSCGTVTLPSWWPHCFSSETWFSICSAQAPASIIFLASRYVASALPNPASMSAMIGHDMGLDGFPTFASSSAALT